MSPITTLLFLSLGSPQAAEISWERVAELFSSDEVTRDEALRALAEARDPSLMAGLNDVLYYHYYGR